MIDGNNDTEKWQWVDEDPLERLLGGLKNARKADAPAPLPQSTPEPVTMAEAGTAPTSNGSDPSAFDLAISLERVEKWDAAAASFRRALEMEPGRVDALIGLGSCLLHLDNAAEALRCFEECLLSNLERARALFGKAVALQKLTRYELADSVYRELLQITPNAAEPLSNLIALSVARQDVKAVGEYSGRLLQIDPHSKTALQGMATQALWSEDHAAAISYLKRIVEVDPSSYEGWFNLGFARQNKRPAERAMRSIA